MRLASFVLIAASLSGGTFAAAAAAAAEPAKTAVKASAPASACPALLNKRFDRLQDEKSQDLCQYAGRVLLVVNTASFCGFTQQYTGLEALDQRYRARGLTVLGFPSNDFSQEKGSNAEIAEFCESTFGVKFPMFVKSAVRGSDANPLFRELAEQSGTTPKWNFYKYLIGRDGRVVKAFSSMTGPDDASLIQALEQELAQMPARP